MMKFSPKIMSLPKLQIMTLVNGNARRTVIYNSKHFRYKRGYKRGMVRKMLVRNTYTTYIYGREVSLCQWVNLHPASKQCMLRCAHKVTNIGKNISIYFFNSSFITKKYIKNVKISNIFR